MGPTSRGSGRAGWVQAPPAVEAEIRLVWQEDEMPEELTSSPGYVPFTLGPDAQAWVDGMAEVVDGGKKVYGRPKPAEPPRRRAFNPPGPEIATPPVDRVAPRVESPPDAAEPPSRPLETPRPHRRAVMPEIAGPDAAAPEPPHPPQRTLPRRVLMPEIGGSAEGPERNATPMPEIGESAGAAEGKKTVMPEIGE
jgi:hypothetical protein